MPDITLQGITKRYGSVKALDDVSLVIPEGEFCVIVGPSGSGKTTLLNVIAGFCTPDSGKLIIDEQNVEKLLPRDRNMGMVFQDIGLFSHMTVRKNLEYGLKVHKKFTKQEIDSKVEAIAKMLHIDNLLEKKSSKISGGEAQRVAIARTLILDPFICLFDEPLGNLDANLRILALEEIKKLHSNAKKTFVFITHDQEQALSAGTMVIVMKDGRVMQAGHPQEIYNNPKNRFVAEFFGISSMNLIDGELLEDKGTLRFCGAGMQLDLSGKEMLNQHVGTNVSLAVRPSNVLLSCNEEGSAGSGTVRMVEKLGDKNLVYLSLGDGAKIVAAAGPGDNFALQDSIKIQFNNEKVFLFGQEDGRRLA